MRRAILLWFTGDFTDIAGVIATKAYYSVNVAMSEDQIGKIARERALGETFLPARKIRAHQIADVQRVENP